MIMPVDIPLWMVGLSVAFAVFIAKEAFGGTGMNILNPALTARAFAFFAYPTYMSGNKVWVSEASNIDSISGETILGSLAAGQQVDFSTSEMFFGSIPGSIAETSTLWVLAGGLVLILTGVGSWRIILGGFLGASIAGIFVTSELNELMSFSWINHLFVGGLAFGIIFMATDPVSAAQTVKKGKWIYGILVGVFCILIRVFNQHIQKVSILCHSFDECFCSTIDHYVVEKNINRRKKRWALNQIKTA